jgi:uncharacterized protein (DUF58 family)
MIGLHFGAMHSARRGPGSDVAGSRPYKPGDDVDTIDWAASARLSAARGTDEFVVRERFAEEAPRAVIVCDLRPAMRWFDAPLPWLSKPKALRNAAGLISESAIAARGFLGYLDLADERPLWSPPRSQRELRELEHERACTAPDDNLELAFEHLERHRRALPAGTFLFVLSDFLVSPPEDIWIGALEHRWDVIPVVIQDPIWEQSFPDVSGIVVPLADPRTGRRSLVRMSAREAAARRASNEQRLEVLLDGFKALDLEPVLLSSDDRAEILWAFAAWSEQRLYRRGQGR